MNIRDGLLRARTSAEAHGVPLHRVVLEAGLTWSARALLRPIRVPTQGDPVHEVFADFLQQVNAMEAPRVLEIGSRARSGHVYTSAFAADTQYVGLDIVAGPNVDVVGDAHALTQFVEPGTFDAVFAISVFEHLAMPWQVVLELNRALKPGGIVFIFTHPAWPLHDQPWDFFRFSSDAFRALFHRLTGFEILQVTEGLPCRIVPLGSEPATLGLERQRTSFLAVAMVARKVGDPDPRLRWDIGLKEFLDSHYPEGNPVPTVDEVPELHMGAASGI